MYLEFHYANTLDLFAKKSFVPADALGFAERVTRRAVQLGQDRMRIRDQNRDIGDTSADTRAIRALDIGCGVGGSAFHLAKGFDEVVAFDSSRAFIDACKRIQERGNVSARVPGGGVLCERPCSAKEARKVRFHVGNACEMVRDAEILGKFDCVIMANLLCRLPKPRACLDGVNEVSSNERTHVFIFTPWSWLDEYTPDAEERLDEFSLVDEMNRRGFFLCEQWEEPCFIREHARKAQYIVSQAHWFQKLHISMD